jgi:hypothetical protein
VVVFLGSLLLANTTAWSQEECLECHGEIDLTTLDESGQEVSVFVDSALYSKSSHGEFDCIDCHGDAEEIPHEERLVKVDCGMCHDDAVAAYQLSVHGQSHSNGGAEAASCVDCHGKHDILSGYNPESRVYPLNVASTCAICHADPKLVKKYHIPVSDPLAAYEKSVHGTAVLSEKNFDAATCVSCHGGHDIRSLGDSSSPIFWKNVPETCGQCHGDIYEQFTESVHGTGVAQGLRDAPVCTDCHGEHTVKSHTDPTSPVHPLRVAAATCERCHASELITERYGLGSV